MILVVNVIAAIWIFYHVSIIRSKFNSFFGVCWLYRAGLKYEAEGQQSKKLYELKASFSFYRSLRLQNEIAEQ